MSAASNVASRRTSDDEDLTWMESKPARFTDVLREQDAEARRFLSSLPGRQELREGVRDALQAGFIPGKVQAVGKSVTFIRAIPGQGATSLVRRNIETGAEVTLFDCSKQGTSRGIGSLLGFEVSPSGKNVAVWVGWSGTEIADLYLVRGALAGAEPEVTRTVAERVAWLPDESGLLYTRAPLGDDGRLKTTSWRLVLHKFGTSEENDFEVFGTATASALGIVERDLILVLPQTTQGFTVVSYRQSPTGASTFAAARIADLAARRFQWRIVSDAKKDGAEVADVSAGRLFLVTNRPDARRSVISRPVDGSPQEKVIFSPDDAEPESIVAAHDGLYVTEKRGLQVRLTNVQFDGSGKRPVTDWAVGALDRLHGATTSVGIVARVTTAQRPGDWVRLERNAKEVDLGVSRYPRERYSALRTRNLTCASADGTAVPLTVISHERFESAGATPTLLSAYGAYGISAPPIADPSMLPWLEKGGRLAVAHVRGGGELGEKWWKAAVLENKYRSAEDFVACAEALIAGHLSTPAQLVAVGASAGGIPVGASVVSRPELFAGALLHSAIVNPTRAGSERTGRANAEEFGYWWTESGLRGLQRIDAVELVRPGRRYPSILATVGANDVRVSPWQSAKLVLRLNDAGERIDGARRSYLRVDFDAGHGGGKGDATNTILERTVDRLAFAMHLTGLDSRATVAP